MVGERELEDAVIVSGSSHPQLAQNIAKSLGVGSLNAVLPRFANGESSIQIPESVRHKDVYIVQSPHGEYIDRHVVEALLMIDAARRSQANSIRLVMPIFPYARQDRKDKPRSPISVAAISKMYEGAKVRGIISLDLHQTASQGTFDDSWDDLPATYAFADTIRNLYNRLPNLKFASPDLGGTKRARDYNELAGIRGSVPAVYKIRKSANKSEIMSHSGYIQDRDIVFVDDMCDTGGSLDNAARYVLKKRARSVRALFTHGVLSGDAVETLIKSPLEEIFLTDSLPLPDKVLAHPKFRVVSVVELLAGIIECIQTGDSIDKRLILKPDSFDIRKRVAYLIPPRKAAVNS